MDLLVDMGRLEIGPASIWSHHSRSPARHYEPGFLICPWVLSPLPLSGRLRPRYVDGRYWKTGNDVTLSGRRFSLRSGLALTRNG